MSEVFANIDLEVSRTDLTEFRLVENELAAPSSGEVLVRVDSFALTANNITYGVAGESIGYWQFFPAAEGYGRIPVWGFADVAASQIPELPEGERLYGYFPMSRYLRLWPERITPGRFVDAAAHRAALPGAYNQYTRVAEDSGYDPEREAEQMLYRPLFMTSFFLDDWLADNELFGAEAVLLSSASSKTSLGLAWMLKRNGRAPVIGLTSPAHLEFVARTGCYDEVVSYDDVGRLPRRATAFVDMAGSGPVRASVHGHFGDALVCSSAVGATHWHDARVGGSQEPLPGPKPTMFFAPAQIEKRAREWGPGGIDGRVAEAWRGFLAEARDWIEIEASFGPDAVAAAYREMVAGATRPDRGVVLSMWPR